MFWIVTAVKALVLKQINHKSIKQIDSSKFTQVPITPKLAKEFLKENSIKPISLNAKYIGLYRKDNLLGVVSYTKTLILDVATRNDTKINNIQSLLPKLPRSLDLRFEDKSNLEVEKITHDFLWTDLFNIYPKNKFTAKEAEEKEMYRIFNAGTTKTRA